MNLFSTTSLIIFVSSISFGISLYAGDRSSKTNRLWFFTSNFIGLWGLGLFGVTWSSSPQTAVWWQYLLDVSGIFIPAAYFSFASEMVGAGNAFWRRAVWGIAAALAAFSFSPLFKVGMTMRYGFYWIDPGPFYIIFPAFFGAVIVATLLIHFRAYRKIENPLLRAQIRNITLAGLVGFGGGFTNFLPQIANVYPFGNYLVLLYLFFMSYGVLKYKIIGAKVASVQLFAGATVIVFLFNLLQAGSPEDIFVKSLLLVLVIAFSIMIVRSVYREIGQRERIENLAKDLEAANARLKELDTAKSEFLSLATHQLRAPITAIKGYASMISEGDFGPTTPEMKEAVDVITQSGDSMAVMVDDFLNISRIEQGRMKYDFVTADVAALAQEVVNELRPAIEKKGLALTFEYDKEKRYDTRMDVGKIKQAITNLIDNAMKYTPRGWIKVSVSRDDAGTIRITVSDSGVGIAPANIPKLFGRFSRISNGISANVSGTGLGLYVVKQMVEAHSGTVSVTSEGEGKGSQFHIDLKAA